MDKSEREIRSGMQVDKDIDGMREDIPGKRWPKRRDGTGPA
jgi:hypothetical protein